MNNKELLKRSFDMKYFRTQCLVAGGIIGGVLVMVLVMFLLTKTFHIAGLIGYVLGMSPFVLYYVYRMWEVAHRPARYTVCEAVAQKAYPAMRGKVYFVIEIALPDGTTLVTETRGVFAMSILTDAYWGEIQGQRLRVLYDADEGSVVVAERVTA